MDKLIGWVDGMNAPKALIDGDGCDRCDTLCDGECWKCSLQKIYDRLAEYEAIGTVEEFERLSEGVDEVTSVSINPGEMRTTFDFGLTINFKNPISYREAQKKVQSALNSLLK